MISARSKTSRALPVVLAAVLLDTIGFGIAMPVLPRLITGLGHVDLAEATRIGGYMLAVFAVGQFLAGPVLGNLGDRYGRRPVLILSMLAFGVDYGLMGLAPKLGWLFVGRAIAGIAGAVLGPANAVIADMTEGEERDKAFALVGAAFGIGFVIGPGVGGLLAVFGERAPFLAAGGLALVNAVAMFFVMPETLAPENRRPFRWRDAHIVSAFRPLFHSGDAAPLLVAWFLWQLASTVYPATWGFWGAIRFGWNATEIGWSLTLVGLMTALFQSVVTPRVLTWAGPRASILAGMVIGVVSLVLFAMLTRSWEAYALLALLMPQGMVMPALNSMLSRLVGPAHQGALQGGVGSMGSVASIIAPLIFTQALAVGAADGFPGAGFLAAAAAVLPAALLVMLKVRGGRAKREVAA